jgi:hypothetical protein
MVHDVVASAGFMKVHFLHSHSPVAVSSGVLMELVEESVGFSDFGSIIDSSLLDLILFVDGSIKAPSSPDDTMERFDEAPSTFSISSGIFRSGVRSSCTDIHLRAISRSFDLMITSFEIQATRIKSFHKSSAVTLRIAL